MPIAPLHDPCPRDRHRSMKSAIIKRLPLVGLIYLLLSLLYFGAVGDYGRMYLGYGLDPVQFIWFLNWWPWAITHGLNPFISYYVWYPHGFNMTWATSMPVAALLMWPLTWLASAGAASDRTLYDTTAPHSQVSGHIRSAAIGTEVAQVILNPCGYQT